MGFADSLKKVIGIEDIEDDEIVTDDELQAEKEKIAKEERRFRREEAPEEAEEHVHDVSSYEDLAIEPKAPKKAPFFSGLGGSTSQSVNSAAAPKAQEKRFSVTNTSSLKLILIEPRSFDECPKLVDSLKARKPVIINLEKLETEIARKIFDFLSGATYALNGNVQKIANNIFIFTPENVSVAAAQAGRNTVAEIEEKTPWR